MRVTVIVCFVGRERMKVCKILRDEGVAAEYALEAQGKLPKQLLQATKLRA